MRKAKIFYEGKTLTVKNPELITIIDGKNKIDAYIDDKFKQACKAAERWRRDKK